MTPTKGLMQEQLDRLLYISYSHNRRLRPDLAPEAFARAGYRNVPEMEAQFQAEIALRKAARED